MSGPESSTTAAPGRLSGRFRLSYPSGFDLDVDFDLPGRGVSALFGASGSGKTTMLRCMAGLERAPDAFLAVAGEVWQDETRGVFVPTFRRPLGYVFQEASLFSHLSVRHNVDYGRRRVLPAERRVAREKAIELLGIGHLLDRMPDHLSGGERQRVAIARALAASPRLLLLDEPLAALDLQRKREVLPYLERLHGELEIPLIYVSHQPDEVARLADHLVLLDRGRVTASGPLAELLTRLDLSLAHGDTAGAVIEATVAAHDEAFHLTYLEFAAGRVSIPREDLSAGTRRRVRVLARDVSVTLAPQTGTSILNILPARVAGLVEEKPGQVMVRLDAAGTALLARVTAKSVSQLGLREGQSVYAQIKGMAMLE
ncbi:MAG: molybdenum ABC transporter ATP-binding protein [Acidobacteria bacterium]|nr:molybdenum ABC transporter ATP-binding protein [Acidobacteriota bacterium]